MHQTHSPPSREQTIIFSKEVRHCKKEYWDILICVNQTLPVCRKQTRWLDTKALLLLKHPEFIPSPVSLLMLLLYLKELGTVSPAKSLPRGASQAADSWHQPLGNCTYAFGGTKAELLWRGAGIFSGFFLLKWSVLSSQG